MSSVCLLCPPAHSYFPLRALQRQPTGHGPRARENLVQVEGKGTPRGRQKGQGFPQQWPNLNGDDSVLLWPLQTPDHSLIAKLPREQKAPAASERRRGPVRAPRCHGSSCPQEGNCLASLETSGCFSEERKPPPLCSPQFLHLSNALPLRNPLTGQLDAARREELFTSPVSIARLPSLPASTLTLQLQHQTLGKPAVPESLTAPRAKPSAVPGEGHSGSQPELAAFSTRGQL
ncbi:PREDICTED: uncharacterized protein LOC105578435 isoform X2 [Cercocebus atys]|uniref:uncharacterized protein LOC105578435 isoform X2 n=1 Tax=Cercocebus atys TaxID=9531 RepID=UPI0005F58C3B|nr:PREDICTED: uncharacterized protein LOC105578435 isoform X2 [Cercocebus atys]